MKWSKIIILCCIGFLISCTKMEIEPMPQPKPVSDIFSVSESSISNGDKITFKLDNAETYIVKLIDKQTGQILSKERIIGKVGENNINIYTKSLQTKYLYLVLEDVTKKEIKRTALNVN